MEKMGREEKVNKDEEDQDANEAYRDSNNLRQGDPARSRARDLRG
jgi:hypothetical protein